MLKSLHVDKHPDKTFIGRVKKGFGFPGFRITPTAIQPSTASVSRHEAKVTRLYEQGATKQRIGHYRKPWLAWVSCLALSGWGAAVEAAFPYGPTSCTDESGAQTGTTDSTCLVYLGVLASTSSNTYTAAPSFTGHGDALDILSNTNHSGSPLWLTGAIVIWDGTRFLNVMMDGASVNATRYNIANSNYEDNYAVTMTFDYDGTRYTMTVSKPANSHTITASNPTPYTAPVSASIDFD